MFEVLPSHWMSEQVRWLAGDCLAMVLRSPGWATSCQLREESNETPEEETFY